MPRDFSVLVSIATLAFLPSPLFAEILAAGTHLEVRLSGPTGSRISHPSDSVEAVVIAPVFAEGRLLIPQGAMVLGAVKRVVRVGLGLKHVTSEIEYGFDAVQLPDGAAVPVESRVLEVETAKERVDPRGVISGIYPTANLSSSVAFFALPFLWAEPEFGVPVLGIKFIIARSPDPEIYFPAGTEIILQLTRQADIPGRHASPAEIAPLSAVEMADAHRVLTELPKQRTDMGRNRPSDLVNILFLGARGAINRAFQAAGWSGAQRSSMISIYRMYHCMAQRTGYSMAPMGKLTLNGVSADVEYQKSLDTFSKRHHLRLWKQGQENIWLSAATEDVDYAVRRMHLTHATDPLIDNERAKVLNDLAFTGCLDAAAMMTRDSSAALDRQEQDIETDGRIAIIRVNDCRHPRTMPAALESSALYARARSSEALIALRNDLIRTNPISLAYNTTRTLRQRENSRVNGSLSAFTPNGRKKVSPEGVQVEWIRPSVLDIDTKMLAAEERRATPLPGH
jgi:hypothetical protein